MRGDINVWGGIYNSGETERGRMRTKQRDNRSMKAKLSRKERAALGLGRMTGGEFQAATAESSIKLLQFGGSSSFLRSIKLARGGNHDSIVRLRYLFLIGAVFNC